MMPYIISIIPIIIYIITLVFLDSFSLINKRKLLILIIYGVTICSLIFCLSEFCGEGLSIFVPLIEEIFKFLLIVILIKNNKFSFITEAMIYGAAIGAGFALMENILYSYYGGVDMNIGVFIYRGFGTAVLHIGLTSMSSVILMLLTKGQVKNIKYRNPLLLAPFALLPSIVFHYLHNSFLINPLISLIITFFSLTTIMLFLFVWNEHIIHKWLEDSMNNEVSLYASIKRGELSDTPSGRYLISVKEKFEPEVYFDMIVCLSLYLEISLLSKRNLMLKEAGLNIPIDEIQSTKNKIIEFKSLKKSIGKTGIYTLSPLINIKEMDNWIKLFFD